MRTIWQRKRLSCHNIYKRDLLCVLLSISTFFLQTYILSDPLFFLFLRKIGATGDDVGEETIKQLNFRFYKTQKGKAVIFRILFVQSYKRKVIFQHNGVALILERRYFEVLNMFEFISNWNNLCFNNSTKHLGVR